MLEFAGDLAARGGSVLDGGVPAGQPLLSVVDVSKSFGSTHALRGVTIDLRAGEVHALVGENGAGKSTLIKIITGLYRPDPGSVYVEGDAVELRSAADAQALGIACIYQEPLVFPDLSVSENIFMNSGRRPVRALARHAPAGRRDPPPTRGRHRSSLAGLATERRCPAGGRDRQGDVARRPGADHGRTDRRAVGARGAAPCSARFAGSTASGVAVLFVSHRLDEVFELSDRITVFRDGQHISTNATSEVTETTLIRDMVGRELADFFHRTAHAPGDVALSVEGLGRRGAFHDVSFEVREGEVLGFAGLVGSGRTEVAEALFGVCAGRQPGSSGAATWPCRSTARATAMDHGIAYVSEDRRRLGLSLPQSVTTNITLAGLRTVRVSLATGRPRGRTAHRRRLSPAARHPHAVACRRRSATSRVATSRR